MLKLELLDIREDMRFECEQLENPISLIKDELSKCNDPIEHRMKKDLLNEIVDRCAAYN